MPDRSAPQEMSSNPFSRLPVDLLPSLLGHFNDRTTLSALCLVSTAFEAVARPLLYFHIRLFGADLSAVKALFEMLSLDTSRSTRLCQLVKILETRVYPLSMLVFERDDMENLSVRVLERLVQLTHLTFTRMGSITNRFVHFTSECSGDRC